MKCPSAGVWCSGVRGVSGVRSVSQAGADDVHSPRDMGKRNAEERAATLAIR